MASRMWDSRNNIDHLPPELLRTPVRDLPMSVLRRIASMLQVDGSPTGNWEMVAEKLGFRDNSRLEELARQAQIQQQFPGLLLLSKWVRREGSTAFVLLHVLRECEREDIVHYLVSSLTEMFYMSLAVMIIDEEGRGQKFLRVRTKKNAPLYASLENIVEPAIYMYDIVGPRRDISWETPSKELQGAQLTLQKRKEPSVETHSLIYGTLNDINGHPFPTLQSCPPPQVIGTGTGQLTFNIPPNNMILPPNITLTYRDHAQIGLPELNLEASRNIHLVQTSQAVTASPPVQSTGPSPRISPLQFPEPPPRPCKPGNTGAGACPGAMPAEQDMNVYMDIDEIQNNDQLTDMGGHGSFPQATFPGGQASISRPMVIPRSLHLQQGPMISHTHPKELAGTSSVFPQGASPYGGNSRRDPEEDDESMEPTAAQVEKPAVRASDSSPIDVGDYIPHDHPMIIRFCNTSPPAATSSSPNVSRSVSGDSSSSQSGFGTLAAASSTTTTVTCSPMFRAVSQDSSSNPTSLDTSEMSEQSGSEASPVHCNLSPGTDYVPHWVLEQGNPQAFMPKSASVPVFSQLLSVPSIESETSLHGCEPLNKDGSVKQEFLYVNEKVQHVEPSQGYKENDPDESLQVENGSWMNVSEASTATPVPVPCPSPCTYSLPFVGHGVPAMTTVGTLPHLYLAVDSRIHRPAPQVSTQQAAVNQSSSTPETGYVDMAGTSVLSSLHWSNSSPVSLSSMPTTCVSFGGFSTVSEELDSELGAVGGVEGNGVGLSLDSGIRNLSSQNSAGSGSASAHHLQPGSRRPIHGPDMESMLNSYLDESNPSQYTYIDPGSADSNSQESRSPPPRRSRPSPASRSRAKPEDRRDSGSSKSQGSSGSTSMQMDDDRLQQVPGWSPTVTERTIESVMARHVNEDGNFVVWRYSTRNKFVISVTHLRNVRHYAVYETEERDSRIYYYIFPRGFRSHSLTDLVAHYQRNSLSEPTKTFRTPEGESREAHRGSANRFSHVKLRKALTVRYGHKSSRSKHQ